MLTVTESAKQLLKETLSAHTDDLEMSLRLSLKEPGQLEIVLGREAEGDQVVEHRGAKVLLVAPELASIVDGTTIDVRDTPNGSKLAVSK